MGNHILDFILHPDATQSPDNKYWVVTYSQHCNSQLLHQMIDLHFSSFWKLKYNTKWILILSTRSLAMERSLPYKVSLPTYSFLSIPFRLHKINNTNWNRTYLSLLLNLFNSSRTANMGNYIGNAFNGILLLSFFPHIRQRILKGFWLSESNAQR